MTVQFEKRRDFYPKQVAKQFKKCPLANELCYLYIIRINLSKLTKEKIGQTIFDTENVTHNFGFLTGSPLPEITPFPMFTENGKHWVEIIELEKNLVFESEELDQIASFHQKFFTHLLKINLFPMKFDPMAAEMSFFVIPVTNDGNINSPMYFPDWDLMEKIINYTIGDLPSEEERKLFKFDKFKFTDALITPSYGKGNVFFMVKDILNELNPTCKFPNDKYDSFVDYFKQKYKIVIQNINQPLITVKMVTNNGFSMLPIKVEKTSTKKSNSPALMVPELFSVLPIKASHFNLGIMIPSIIYRLNDLLLSIDLLNEISTETNLLNLNELIYTKWSKVELSCRDEAIVSETNWQFDYKTEYNIPFEHTVQLNPPSHVLLNAFTTRAANDCFNLERFEFLGDSFLKYATSLYLLNQFPMADEGKLTKDRADLICNPHLHQLAETKKLANLVKSEIFSPISQWLPPSFVTNTKSIKDLKTVKYQLISHKSIADSVEAIIGVFLLYSGPDAALKFLLYLGLTIFPLVNMADRIMTIPYEIRNTDDKLVDLNNFERKIGYFFKDKSFLIQAFTHSSYNNDNCYQRLEFLGDAILDYLITWNLFKDKKKLSPGKLTDRRSALVNNDTFATLAVKNSFHCYLVANSSSLVSAVCQYVDIILKRENSSLYYENQEQVKAPKVLGDLFESVAGAIYLDSGCSLDAVWDVYSKMMASVIDEYSISTPKAPVREVHEMFPHVKFENAVEEVKKTKTEQQMFSMIVKLGGEIFKGFGSSTKNAKIQVAQVVLLFVKVNPLNLKSFAGVDLTNTKDLI